MYQVIAIRLVSFFFTLTSVSEFELTNRKIQLTNDSQQLRRRHWGADQIGIVIPQLAIQFYLAHTAWSYAIFTSQHLSYMFCYEI